MPVPKAPLTSSAPLPDPDPLATIKAPTDPSEVELYATNLQLALSQHLSKVKAAIDALGTSFVSGNATFTYDPTFGVFVSGSRIWVHGTAASPVNAFLSIGGATTGFPMVRPAMLLSAVWAWTGAPAAGTQLSVYKNGSAVYTATVSSGTSFSSPSFGKPLLVWAPGDLVQLHVGTNATPITAVVGVAELAWYIPRG